MNQQCGGADSESGESNEVAGYIFQESFKGGCSGGNNMVFESKFSSIKSCAKKCSNAPTCLYFSSTVSKNCVGYKNCNGKTLLKEENKIYKKGCQFFLQSYLWIYYNEEELSFIT